MAWIRWAQQDEWRYLVPNASAHLENSDDRSDGGAGRWFQAADQT
jgi:hypothetical protein